MISWLSTINEDENPVIVTVSASVSGLEGALAEQNYFSGNAGPCIYLALPEDIPEDTGAEEGLDAMEQSVSDVTGTGMDDENESMSEGTE
ncbi:MAG TPA: hypothetical protein DCZ91_21510 [Lachnospiraceae bacterium]|nr:hypothetical protein [Lachnospiraceae bacterium]